MGNGPIETALLIGQTGRIFDFVQDVLASKGIVSIRINEDVIRDYKKSLQTALSVFDKAEVKYIVYSVLVDKKQLPAHIKDMSVSEWQMFKEMAFTNVFNINRTFVKLMSERGGGYHLTVGSIAGIVPVKGEEVNGAVSASAFMVMKSNALELAQQGITVNAVALGLLDEDAEMAVLEDTEAIRKHIPGGKALKCRDAAISISQVLTVNSPHLSGVVIPLDYAFSCGFMRDW